MRRRKNRLFYRQSNKSYRSFTFVAHFHSKLPNTYLSYSKIFNNVGVIWYSKPYFRRYVYCIFSHRLKCLVWANVLHSNSLLPINSLTVIYVIFVWSKLEQQLSPGNPPNILFAIAAHINIKSLSCACSVWMPLFRIVLACHWYCAYIQCYAVEYVLIIFCHCQGLTGLVVKSNNNNNNNNNNNTLCELNRYFNIVCLSFAKRWRWCVMD